MILRYRSPGSHESSLCTLQARSRKGGLFKDWRVPSPCDEALDDILHSSGPRWPLEQVRFARSRPDFTHRYCLSPLSRYQTRKTRDDGADPPSDEDDHLTQQSSDAVQGSEVVTTRCCSSDLSAPCGPLGFSGCSVFGVSEAAGLSFLSQRVEDSGNDLFAYKRAGVLMSDTSPHERRRLGDNM